MSISISVLLFALGTVLVIKGGDIFIDAAGWMSDVSGISRAVIGATVVSFATTSPEFFVSTIAILKGYNDLSVGNAVGSLLCNLGLGFAALAMFTPGRVADKLYGIKALTMLGAGVSLWLFCLNGFISVAEAALLLGIYVFFTYVNISKSDKSQKPRKATNAADITKNVMKFVGGCAAIIAGSNFIVDSGQAIAKALGVSEAVIGLTVVAVGTSLPEVVTAVSAIVKKESDLSIGNIIGANTLDATLILSTGAFISGGRLSVSPQTTSMDLPATILLMAIAALPTAVYRRVFRWQGGLILILYIVYIAKVVVM